MRTPRRDLDVFAIGDLRRGSTKRVAAVGDGALVGRSIHAALDAC